MGSLPSALAVAGDRSVSQRIPTVRRQLERWRSTYLGTSEEEEDETVFLVTLSGRKTPSTTTAAAEPRASGSYSSRSGGRFDIPLRGKERGDRAEPFGGDASPEWSAKRRPAAEKSNRPTHFCVNRSGSLKNQSGRENGDNESYAPVESVLRTDPAGFGPNSWVMGQ
ncbi:hypothetical protein V6N11_067842 [Hibiscus sabdariffa]|uniref:Uncharacterized protein n=1 Tax=Hibiscus sabdariffa TaxID=183260 RepID=A0ABR2SSX9_9ROSI